MALALWRTIQHQPATGRLAEPRTSPARRFGNVGPRATWEHDELDPELEAPSPCPLDAPALDVVESYGWDAGSYSLSCGYPCENGNWTVLSFLTESSSLGGTGTWQSDGWCDLPAGSENAGFGGAP